MQATGSGEPVDALSYESTCVIINTEYISLSIRSFDEIYLNTLQQIYSPEWNEWWKLLESVYNK